MIARFRTHFLVAITAVALIGAGCGDDADAENDSEPTNQQPGDYDDPPLEDIDALTDGAPSNDELGEEAKADETFPAQFDDLVEKQSPVSDQGRRGICSIFSTVGLMEHLYILNEDKPNPEFSEQHLQWSTKKELGRFTNTSGSNAQVNLQAISQVGVVEEDVWPYESTPWGPSDHEECEGDNRPTICYTNGNPDDEVLDAPHYSLPGGRFISTRTRDIKAHMYNQGQAVVTGGDFFYQAWNHGASDLPTNDEYRRQGYVLYPNEVDKETSLEDRVGHSFLLVGWDDELEVERVDENGEVKTDEDGEPITEQGFFIFKNSWGTGGWGSDNPHGDGYGFISYQYVEDHLTGRVADIPGPEHVPDEAQDDEPDCTDDELECDGVCVPIDEDNCGECGESCADGEICDSNQCVAPEGEEHSYEWGGGPVDIPDYDPDAEEPGEVTIELEVENSGIIEEVVSEVYIEHTWNGDLQIDLTHPDGEQVRLREADGSPGEDVIDEFETDAFDGLDPEGTWELTVSDHAYHDEGAIIGWYLHITH